MQRQVGKQCFVVFLVLIKGFVTGGRLGLLEKKVSLLEAQYQHEVASLRAEFSHIKNKNCSAGPLAENRTIDVVDIKELKKKLSEKIIQSIDLDVRELKEAGRAQLNGIIFTDQTELEKLKAGIAAEKSVRKQTTEDLNVLSSFWNQQNSTAKAHGGWAMWTSWTTCTGTCGTGLTHRRRDCNSPPPSLFGEYCHGVAVEYILCVERQCPKISFSVHSPSSFSYSKGHAIIFTEIVNNEGDGYSSSTGKFTAPVTGQYLFSMTVMEHDFHAEVYLMKNNNKIGMVYPEAKGHDDDTASVTTAVNLDKGDTVWAKFSYGSIFNNIYTSFTGVLIHP